MKAIVICRDYMGNYYIDILLLCGRQKPIYIQSRYFWHDNLEIRMRRI